MIRDEQKPIICRTKKLKSLGFQYILSKPLIVIGSAVVVFLSFWVYELISSVMPELLTMKNIVLSFFIFIFLLFSTIIFLKIKLNKKFQAYIIKDNQIYMTNMVLKCFKSYIMPSVLGTIMLILSLSNIIPFPFILSFLLLLASLLLFAFDYIRCSVIMYRTVTSEYIGNTIERYDADFVFEKIIDIREYEKYIKVRVKLRKLNPVKGEWQKTVKRTLKIPLNYENADYLIQQIKFMIIS